MKEKLKSSKGITLVALVITIIVLLILATVSINLIIDTGIIGRAQNAVNAYGTAQTNEIEKLNALEDYMKNISGENGNSNIGTVTDEGVPIPKGFTYVTGTKDTGVVITDGTSEFVWVPVPESNPISSYGLGTSDYREPDVVTGANPSETVDSASGEKFDAVLENLERAGCTDVDKNGNIDAYDFKQQLTNEFNSMATSVNKYHGFYVGRYEMSLNSGGTAQSKQGETSMYNNKIENNWYGLYAKAKTYTNPENSVVSSMIWGSQYDAMMAWIGDAANNNIGDNRNKERTTGTCPTDFINNIYDLYGNSNESTLGANDAGGRAARSGSYIFANSLIGRYNVIPTAATYGYDGTRLVLYIK